ncbi:hypothetical protein BJ742DRAFT_786095 [Cladochytrium replicatum]|nr:hypothetical protein BJ742DRAFT_786095 [Cladochytrium replicatum]
MATSPLSGTSPVPDSDSALSTSASTATTALNLDNKDLEDLVTALDSVDLSISEFTDGLLDFCNEKDQKAAHPHVVKARSPLGLDDGTGGDDEDTEDDDDSDEDDTEDDEEEEDSEEFDEEEGEDEGDEPEPEVAEPTEKRDAAPATAEKEDRAKAGGSSMMDLFSGWGSSSTETSPPQPQNEDVQHSGKSVVNPAIAKLRAASPTGLPPPGNKRASVARKRISKFVGLGELSFEKSDFDFSSLQFTAKTYKLGKTAAEKEAEREEEKARKRAERQQKKEAAAAAAAAEAAAKANELEDRSVSAVRSNRARKVESILLQNSSQSPIAGLMSAVAGGDQAKINELKRILEAKQTQMRASLLPPPRNQPEFGSEGSGAPNRGMESPEGMYRQPSGPGYGAPHGNAYPPAPGAGSQYGYAQQQQQYGQQLGYGHQQQQQQFAQNYQSGYDPRMANPQQPFASPSRGPPQPSSAQTPPGAADLPSINTNWTAPPRTMAAPGAPPTPVSSVPPTPPRTPQVLLPAQDTATSEEVPHRRTARPQVSITLPTREDSAASTPSPAGYGSSSNAVSPTRIPPVSPTGGSSGATSPNPHVPPRGTSATHSARMRDSAVPARGSSQPARNSPVIQSVSPPPQPPTPSKGETYQTGGHGHTPPPGALPPQVQQSYSQGQYSSPKAQPLPYQSPGQVQYQSPQTPYHPSQQPNQSTPHYQQPSQYQSQYQSPPPPSKPPIQPPFGSPPGAPPPQQQQINGTGVKLVSSSSHIKTIPLSALHKSGQAAIQVAVPQDALQFQPTTTSTEGGGGGGVPGLELLRGDFGVSDSVVMGVYNPSAVKTQVSSSPYQGGVYQGGRGPQGPGQGPPNMQGQQGQQQQQQGGVMGRLWGGR